MVICESGFLIQQSTTSQITTDKTHQTDDLSVVNVSQPPLMGIGSSWSMDNATAVEEGEDEVLMECKNAFEAFVDSESQGSVTPDALKRILQLLGYAPTEDEFDRVVGNGKIDQERFVKLITNFTKTVTIDLHRELVLCIDYITMSSGRPIPNSFVQNVIRGVSPKDYDSFVQELNWNKENELPARMNTSGSFVDELMRPPGRD